MSPDILKEIIIGAVTLIATLLTVWQGIRKSNQKAEIHQAVTDTKIEELTREVRKHNGFAERLPVIEEQIKVIDYRISALEEEVKK